jgi:hypothetical protein
MKSYMCCVRLVMWCGTVQVTRLVEEVEALRRNVEEGEPAQKAAGKFR